VLPGKVLSETPRNIGFAPPLLDISHQQLNVPRRDRLYLKEMDLDLRDRRKWTEEDLDGHKCQLPGPLDSGKTCLREIPRLRDSEGRDVSLPLHASATLVRTDNVTSTAPHIAKSSVVSGVPCGARFF
jgi:hypothetical protein